MIALLIEDISAAFYWARAARSYIAEGRRVAPASVFCPCP